LEKNEQNSIAMETITARLLVHFMSTSCRIKLNKK